MNDSPGATAPQIRTAVPADLPELQRIYQAASLSNARDAPLLLARPEFLVFTGDGVAEGRTRVAVAGGVDHDRVLGFATLVDGQNGEPELEDLFVDPERRREGIARALVHDAARTALHADHHHLWVIANPHALAFYRAVGFVELDHVATELGSGIRMRRELART